MSKALVSVRSRVGVGFFLPLVWGVLGSILAPLAQAQTPAPTASKAALTVQAVEPKADNWPMTLAASGNVAAWQEASIGAEAAGLRLIELRADVGDLVTKGQVLARLSADTAQADLAQAQAALAETQAVLAEAQANTRRARDLAEQGMFSAQALNQALTAEQTARARMAAAEARMAAEKVRLAQTEVRAPDGGIITHRSATLGAVPGSGNELFRLMRQGRLEWRAEVPFADMHRVRPGQTATVQTADGSEVNGTVRKVAPTVEATTRNALVWVDLPSGSSHTLRPGMFVRGQLRLSAQKVQTLPASAVLLRDGLDVVMQLVPGADAKAADAKAPDTARVAQTRVQVVGRQGERVAVSGLDPQARVVERGAAFLADGDTVRVVGASGK